jgi:hypothetical protein
VNPLLIEYGRVIHRFTHSLGVREEVRRRLVAVALDEDLDQLRGFESTDRTPERRATEPRLAGEEDPPDPDREIVRVRVRREHDEHGPRRAGGNPVGLVADQPADYLKGA